VVGFLSFNDEPEQYLATAVLRPGNAVASAGAIGILWRLLGRVWRAFPQAGACSATLFRIILFSSNGRIYGARSGGLTRIKPFKNVTLVDAVETLRM